MSPVGFQVDAGPDGVDVHTFPTAGLVTSAERDATVVVLLGELHYRGDPGSADAEHVLDRYRAGGAAALRDLEGEFALAVVDGGRVFALRDTMGAHPLYWARNGSRVTVATGMPPGRSGDLDRSYVADYLADYLAGGAPVQEPAGETTPVPGIRRVRAGECLCVDVRSGTAATSRFLPSIDAVADPGTTFDDAAGAYRDVLAAAVRERARGAVACHVSGGLDSTAVLVLAADTGVSDLRGASVVYERLRLLSGETRYVDAACSAVPGLPTIRVLGDDLLDFDAFADPPALDEPYPGLWRLGMDRALTDAVAASGATRVLTGIGADEVLDAQPLHLADDLRRLRLLPAWREACRWAENDVTDPWTVLVPFGIAPLLRRVPLPRCASTEVPPWIRADFARSHDLPERMRARSRSRTSTGVSTGVAFALDAIRSRVGDPIRWSLATPRGLTVTHPFLDPRVLRAGLSALASRRPEPGISKPLLRAALGDRLPEPIRTRRRKAHFNEIYYRGLLRNRDHLAALVRSPAVADLGIFEPEVLVEAIDRGAVGGTPVTQMHRINLALTLASWIDGSCHEDRNLPDSARSRVVTPERKPMHA